MAATTGLVITGGTVVSLDPPAVTRRDVVMGPSTSRERIDAAGCLLMPGLGLAHTHLYSGLARGMPGPDAAPRSFREVLEKVWWKLDRALDAETLRSAAEVALLEAVLCGVTTVVDHHESPSFIDGSLDVLAEAARAVGVRVLLTYGATDRHGHAGALAGLAECERALAAGLPAAVGLHAGFTVTDETLAAAADLARRRKAWIHVHLAEDGCDAGSFDRLEKAGLIGPASILAHGVHLSAAERQRVAAAGATVVHNPRSNLQNAVGYADVRTFPGRVALGTDGMDADLFTEARVAHLAGRAAYGPVGGIDAVRLLAEGRRLADALAGADARRRLAGTDEGPHDRVAGERADDWVVLEYDPPTPLEADNLPGHVLFGLGARHVRDVVVAGEPVVRNRKSTRVDASEVHGRAREQARRLWGRMERDRGPGR